MKRDLEEYLLSLEKQHQDMKKAADEANQLLADGKISQEQANQILSYMTTIDTNYNRVLYCRYLANLPPKFIQKIQNKKIRDDLEKFQAEHSDRESIEEENQESLDGINEIISEEGSEDE